MKLEGLLSPTPASGSGKLTPTCLPQFKAVKITSWQNHTAMSFVTESAQPGPAHITVQQARHSRLYFHTQTVHISSDVACVCHGTWSPRTERAEWGPVPMNPHLLQFPLYSGLCFDLTVDRMDRPEALLGKQGFFYTGMSQRHTQHFHYGFLCILEQWGWGMLRYVIVLVINYAAMCFPECVIGTVSTSRTLNSRKDHKLPITARKQRPVNRTCVNCIATGQ